MPFALHIETVASAGFSNPFEHGDVARLADVANKLTSWIFRVSVEILLIGVISVSAVITGIPKPVRIAIRLIGVPHVDTIILHVEESIVVEVTFDGVIALMTVFATPETEGAVVVGGFRVTLT
jgi:hypothetical protein